ncbi:hypothetical protein D3C79_924620 [compost metagenome]
MPCGAARSKLEIWKLCGFMPPLKYEPTGMANTEKMNSGAVRTPMLSPVPITNGRRYRAPLPCGGTNFSLALTTCLHASMNTSVGTCGISRRAQLRCMRAAFWSGRNRLIEPSLQR